MRVLLVNTNRMKPAIAPIGLDYIADSVVAAGHEPRLLDLCFSDDVPADIARGVRASAPDVVGVTVRNTDDCYFSGGAFFLPGIREMVSEIRKACDAPIVMGGVGFSVAPKHVLEFCGGDYGIAGPGERSFALFLEAWERQTEFERVPNLLYRENGKIRRTSETHADYDHVPPRSRALADNARYFAEGGQAGFETRRGCNMNCIYCADPVSKGRHVRLRAPGLVVDELRTLLAQGIDHFHTCDCEFNIPGDHAKDICRAIIESGIGDKINWYAYCSVAPFDEEMAELFRRAGCAGVDFGADSANDAMLARLGRHFRSEDLARTAQLCHKHGIPFMYDLLVGAPGDTRESVRETIEFMCEIDADCVGVSMGVRIYDGTAMADIVRAEGGVSTNPNLHGAKQDNPHFVHPVHYIAPDLGGPGVVSYLHELVDGDPRFFLPSNEEVESNYNYNDNSVLVNAIRDGARGAFWNILRRVGR